MRLDEAIKQAGPGGRVRRDQRDAPHFIVGGLARECLWNTDGTQTGGLSIIALTATDWQVVEDKPVIEEGDTVRCPIVTQATIECTVHRIKHFVDYPIIVRQNDFICCCSDKRKDDLTLISKGPKVYVTENVQFELKGNESGSPEWAHVHVHMQGTLDTTKNYDMQLTERPD